MRTRIAQVLRFRTGPPPAGRELAASPVLQAAARLEQGLPGGRLRQHPPALSFAGGARPPTLPLPQPHASVLPLCRLWYSRDPAWRCFGSEIIKAETFYWRPLILRVSVRSWLCVAAEWHCTARWCQC